MASKRKQRLTPQALLEIRSPAEVHISPDASRVAFVVEETDWEENEEVQHLFVGRVLSGEGDDGGLARQVTHGKPVDAYPRWSPDGKWLAFLRTADENADEDDGDDESRAQVWLLPMDGLGGEAEKLTDAKEGVGIYDWLPDSSGIVYLAREPRPKPLQTAYEDKIDDADDAVVDREERFRQQIWRIDREHKRAGLVHAGDYGVGEIAVSPDGKLVAFSTNYTGEPNDYHKVDIWAVPVDGGEARPLAQGPGGKFHPVWAPDGSRVYYATTLDPEISYSQEKLYSVGLDGGAPVPETAEFPHDLTGWHGFQFDKSGALYLSVALGTSTVLYVRRDGRFEPLLGEDEHIQEFSVAKDGTIAFISSAVDDAPEVYALASGRQSKPVALSDLNDDWMDDYELASTDLMTWPSTGGFEIEGMVTYPLGYVEGRRYPTIVSLHGGPHGRAVQSLMSNGLHQLLAAAGFLVFAPNYRGSEGYGNAFSTASRGDLGGGDFEDVIAGIDRLIEEGAADGDRLGIMGSSYGGYLVNWAIARTKRFKAAVSAFGIFSFFTDFSNSEAPRWESEYLGGAYWEIPDEYHRRSPSTYARDIETPVLILHGVDDPNTFVANSHELYNALRLQGKTAQFVRYPREGHGFFEPRHRIDELRRCRAWFEKYLAPADAPAFRLGDHVDHAGWRLTVVRADIEDYAGSTEKDGAYLEVQIVLRDTGAASELNLTPGDFSLSRRGSTGRKIRPAGVPVDVLGQKSLAQGHGWRFRFHRRKDEPEIAAAVAVAFPIDERGGEYDLIVNNFPSVALEIAPLDDDGRAKEKLKKA